MEINKRHQVVCFGEILWDIFPTGAVPGGAPLNVAYHLHKKQKTPALITRIGLDDKGKELVNIFSGHGVCTDYFQVDYEYETGKVYAEPGDHNEMEYDIVKPAAWDFISWEDSFAGLVSQADFFVFGSLAARSRLSKETLFRLLDLAATKVLDINLRAPHFNRRLVEDLLTRADFVKINLAELELITGWFSQYNKTEDRIKLICDQFNISNVVVTKGGEGALWYSDGNIYSHNGYKVEVTDTIGSGDAFLAGLLAKQLDNATPGDALDFACGLGAFIATQHGACPIYEIVDVENLMNEKKQTA